MNTFIFKALWTNAAVFQLLILEAVFFVLKASV